MWPRDKEKENVKKFVRTHRENNGTEISGISLISCPYFNEMTRWLDSDHHLRKRRRGRSDDAIEIAVQRTWWWSVDYEKANM